jgi:hypothetical protein
MGGEATSVPDWSEANLRLCLGYPAPKISRLACFLIVARPLAKLEEDIPELMIHNILWSTTNLYNQVAATIFSPRSTDDRHNEGREACRQGRLASPAEQIASAFNYCHGNSIAHRGLAIGSNSTGLFGDLFWWFVAPESLQAKAYTARGC